MNQQKANQKHRMSRRTQTFRFNPDVLRGHGKRSGTFFGNVNPNDNTDGFARWSDYISESSQDLYIPKEQEETFQYLEKQQILLDNGKDHSAQPQPETSVVHIQSHKSEVIKETKSTTGIKKKNQEVPLTIEPVQKIQKKMVIPNVSIKQKEKDAPFYIPQISSIKHRKSIGRRSQEFLLDLLKSTKSRREEEAVAEKQVKPIPQKVQQDKSTKSKRVTINDRGKIKLPSDSFSAEYEPILPYSLRKYQDDSLKRPLPISIEQHQEQKQETHEPMDIIAYKSIPNQEYNHSEKDTKGSGNTDKIKKSIRIREQNGPFSDQNLYKEGKQRTKSHKGKRSLGKETKSKQPKAISKRSKAKSQQAKQSQEKFGNSLNPQINSQPVQKIQKQRKKMRKNENNDNKPLVSKHITTQEQSSNSRPLRVRTEPLKFWLNERQIFNLKNERILHASLKSKQFLEIVGFSKPERVISSFVTCSAKQIMYKISIKPNQCLSSTGINYTLMKNRFDVPEQFDELHLSCEYPNPQFEVTIDHFKKQSLLEPIIVHRNQTFELKNQADFKTFILTMNLVKGSKSR